MSAAPARRFLRFRPRRGQGVWRFPVSAEERATLYIPALEAALQQDLAEVQTGFRHWKRAVLEEMERRWATPSGRPYSADEQRLLAVHQGRMMTLRRQSRLDLERDLRLLRQRLKTDGERQARATALELSRILERERFFLEDEARRERTRQLDAERLRLENDLARARADLAADAEQTRGRAMAAERERHARQLDAELAQVRERLRVQDRLSALRDELSLRHAHELDTLNVQLTLEREAQLRAEQERGEAALVQERQALEAELGALAAAEQEECQRQHSQALDRERAALETGHLTDLEKLRVQHGDSLSARLRAERERLAPELKQQATAARARWEEERQQVRAEQLRTQQADAEATVAALRAELEAAHAEQLARERAELEGQLAVTLRTRQEMADHALEEQLAPLRAAAQVKLAQALEEQRRAAQAFQAQRLSDIEGAEHQELGAAWSRLEAELLAGHEQALAEQATRLEAEAAALEQDAQRGLEARMADTLAERTAALSARLAAEYEQTPAPRRIRVAVADPSTTQGGVSSPQNSAHPVAVIAGVSVPPNILPDAPDAVLGALRLITTHGEVAERDLGRFVPPEQSVRRFRRDLDGVIEALVQNGEHVFLRVTRPDDTYYILNPRRRQEQP
ncbi:hypothetical protein DGo_CA2764 [Deinococcus gobiensis I-0]|uniref:Uncharacterized protein n=1 Tax=Deinococcus gobiensis (strain DSM 21396 / JCM 16679 / CGMCC 1.7299 / I-0) TaxID=745776 RepID=H8GUK8_DEIGI|nr:hypothetical protein DGo_CA2764 [Deinococcus gobiensis I-0]